MNTGNDKSPEVNLLLVGMSGHGKSSTGNSIAGRDVFKASKIAQTVTLKCQKTTIDETIDGKQITVIDTPPLDERDTIDRIHNYMKGLTSPTILVLVIRTLGTRWNTEMEQCLTKIDWDKIAPFRPRYILLTGISDESIKEEYLKGVEKSSFWEVIEQFGGLKNIFILANEGDYKDRNARDFLKNILKKVEISSYVKKSFRNYVGPLLLMCFAILIAGTYYGQRILG